MANCEYSKSCVLYNKTFVAMPKIYEYMKNKYCENNFSECDRFKLYQSMGFENVPNDLLPTWFNGLRCFCGKC